MSGFVLDASLTMAWCFESEATPYTEAILAQMGKGEQAWVPTFWRLEVVNSLLKAKRRGHVNVERCEHFLAQLREFAIEFDDQSLAKADTELFHLALKHQLSSYDALYLELAIRRKLPLATQDSNLAQAARAPSVPLVQL